MQSSKKKPLIVAGFLVLFSLAVVVPNYTQIKSKALRLKAWASAQKRKRVTKGNFTDFTLLDHNGEIQMLYRNADAKAVVIIAQLNGCPIIQKYAPKIRELVKSFESRGVRFLMINPNLTDDRASLIQEAKEYDFGVPILMDPSQIVTRELGLTRSAEVVIISTDGWNVVYRGPIDDQIGFEVNRQKSNSRPLEEALEAVLGSRTVQAAEFAAKGCALTLKKDQIKSYAKEIRPIFEDRCVSCHSGAGGFKPDLTEYRRIKNWTSMIRETLFTDRMPPFSADTFYGEYENDISLTPDQKRLLVDWIDQGAPGPTGEDLPMENSKGKYKQHFIATHEPVFSAKMPEPFSIPPEGTVEYNYIQIAGPLVEDIWVSAFVTNTTNPRQLHHESLMVTPNPLSHYRKAAAPLRNEQAAQLNTDGDMDNFVLKGIMREENTDPDFNRFQVWAAGRPKVTFTQKGTRYYLPKGHYLILETHYMGTGKSETEQTTIDFYGEKENLGYRKQKAHMLRILNFQIPAGAKSHKILTKPWVLPFDIELHAFMGHLHIRGKSERLILKDENGERTIGSIPNYYYAWQVGSALKLKKPMKIKKGSQLIGECVYDNSAQNPNNPDPEKEVRFGQTVDRAEMCLLHLSYSAAQ